MLGGLGISYSAQAARSEGPEVLDVRVAVHDDGTTRFVLELSEDVSYTVATIAGGVTIDTPALDWRSKATGLLRPIGLISGFSYSVAKTNTGRIFIASDDAVVVQKAFMIPPNATGAYRLVIDIDRATLGPATTVAAANMATAAAPPVPIAKPAPPPIPGNDNPMLGHGGPSQLTLASVEVPAPPPAPSSAPKPVEVAAVNQHGIVPEPYKPHGKPIVMLDPGHGGVDPGTIGLSGEFEKDIVLPLALAVKERLDKDGKVKCLMTRSDDTFIPLQERVAIARAAHADLFMSLHADSDPDPAIRGLSVYTLSKNASDVTAQALADKENKSDLVAGLNLSNTNAEVTSILIDLVQRETLNNSAAFAGDVIDEVRHDTKALLENTHRFAGFAVLKAPDVPSVLVESGYLTNRDDEQLLRKPEYRVKLAAALARAIERYFAGSHEKKRG
ncbi:MAG TPA: N-acetylmuramoyl-L-alanine amidase [Magnetospirillaceae bacterium]